eukprot:TRINITY_DN2202_c0_g1_i2.p1 TRINITY_DN2202_c0_g1~~TRINITY_DN2202_c0_g1_i2.p1  ORF type:complete len:114 (-),score=22.78 TRINITY_DN2202_c0_g1_i2:284-625(-)
MCIRDRFQIQQIDARGGTNMEIGFNQAVEMLTASEINPEYEHRIFFLTDAMPNQGTSDSGGLLSLNKAAAQQKIYTTFFGVGLDFNVSLIETISKTTGCCYYSIHNEKDFKLY